MIGLVACLACPHQVPVTSSPSPATLTLPDGAVVSTPTVVTLMWVPFGHQWIRAEADGYHPLDVDLRRTEVTLGRYFTPARRGTHLLLVPRRGPVETWNPSDVP